MDLKAFVQRVAVDPYSKPSKGHTEKHTFEHSLGYALEVIDVTPPFTKLQYGDLIDWMTDKVGKVMPERAEVITWIACFDFDKFHNMVMMHMPDFYNERRDIETRLFELHRYARRFEEHG